MIPQLAGIGHAKVAHGRFQFLVAEPNLERPDRDPGLHPSCRTRLAKTVKVDMFANRIGRAGNFHFVFVIVSTFGDCRPAMTTIQACV